MNFSWTYQVPNESWWTNYRWHIVKPSKELGLKTNGWKKTFFRSGWQSRVLEIDNIDKAKKVLQSLRNGTITAFGGKFRGASYDKNAERIVKQARRSLEEAIEKHNKGETINIKETATVPPSYYNWWLIIPISGVILMVLVLAGLIWWKKRAQRTISPKIEVKH